MKSAKYKPFPSIRVGDIELPNRKPQPKACEICHQGRPERFVHFAPNEWRFTCYSQCSEGADYELAISDFFLSRFETLDWLCHLRDKTWFKLDVFMDMLERYRDCIRK